MPTSQLPTSSQPRLQPSDHCVEDSTKSTEVTVATPMKTFGGSNLSPLRPVTSRNELLSSRQSLLQLQLIEEVNSKATLDEESTTAFSIASEENSTRSRVQKIPKTEGLPALFGRIKISRNYQKPNGRGIYGAATEDLPPSTPLQNVAEVADSRRRLPKMKAYFASGKAKSQSFSEATLQEHGLADKVGQLPKEVEHPPRHNTSSGDYAKPQSPIYSAPPSPRPQQGSPTNRPRSTRLIKYLGLVIEKDEEYILQLDDKCGAPNEIAHPDGSVVRREYRPIREHYISIVKNCRRLILRSRERKFHHDYLRTSRGLNHFGKELTGQK